MAPPVPRRQRTFTVDQLLQELQRGSLPEWLGDDDLDPIDHLSDDAHIRANEEDDDAGQEAGYQRIVSQFPDEINAIIHAAMSNQKMDNMPYSKSGEYGWPSQKQGQPPGPPNNQGDPTAQLLMQILGTGGKTGKPAQMGRGEHADQGAPYGWDYDTLGNTMNEMGYNIDDYDEGTQLEILDALEAAGAATPRQGMPIIEEMLEQAGAPSRMREQLPRR